jgi:hypothetical protein
MTKSCHAIKACRFQSACRGFHCEIEASKVPPIDAQAEDWFLAARALEDPEIFVEDRDYKKSSI